MIEICTTDPDDKDIDQRYFKLISAVKVDNLFENLNDLDSPHIMLDCKRLEQNDTLWRLMRMIQNYKTEISHARNLGLTQYEQKLGRSFNIASLINTIDYTQQWGRNTSKFDVELSYTILDLIIAEKIVNIKDFLI